MDQLEPIKKMRAFFNKVFLKLNTIDRLMTDKVDDMILIEEAPLPIIIGMKRVWVGNLTLENEDIFFQRWARLSSLLAARVLNWEISEERKKELFEKASFHMLADAGSMATFIMQDKLFKKELTKLLSEVLQKNQRYYFETLSGKQKQITWDNVSSRYMYKHMTKEKLIQIGYLIYLYNFDSVKKNLSVLMDKVQIRALSETYIPFWWASSTGLSGKFLEHQAPSVDSVFADSPKTTTSPPRRNPDDDEEKE